MLEYVYIVKCPNCKDEHFYFFEEAKERAMSLLTKKPIITQVEVNRNDFRECTDSCDLGTIWSWEDMMTDDELANTVFSKADTVDCDDCFNHEFDNLDNSLEPITEETEACTLGFYDRETEDQVLVSFYSFADADEYVASHEGVRDLYTDPKYTSENYLKHINKYRKPVPADMTLEALVEEMEENEDTVECKWCDELFDKSECRYEVDLGWLCDGCQQAIKSRGETLTFRENTYWDFLDESIPAEWFANCVDHSDMEIWGLEPVQDDIYKAVLLKRFENVSYRGGDETQKVTDEMYDIDGAFTFGFGKDGLPSLHSWNTNLLRKLGSIRVDFKDGRYEDAAAKVFSRSADLSEAMDPREMVELEYPSLTVTLYGPKRAEDDWDEVEHTDSHVFLVPKVEVATAIWENWITEEDVADVEGGLEALEDDSAWEKFLETHFDALFEKYNKEILKYFEDEAIEDFRERSQEDCSLGQWKENSDRAYDELMDDKYFSESKQKPFLEEFDDAETHKANLIDCPECGTVSYDMKEQYCTNCGLGI